ncbi:MAG: ABC transporter substrate-binding protein [Deltaproteobacteria bacterium]|nr:MAG: ABC transporter substrate-binding protein [Deltaproteobacteria bacterium]
MTTSHLTSAVPSTTRLLVLVAVVLLVVPVVSHAGETESEATRFVQERADQVIAIVNREAPDSTAQAQRERDLQRAIREFLSFELLAERTLGSHWEERSAEERSLFVGLLRELIETSYLRRLGGDRVEPGSYTVSYESERVRRSRATVSGRVTARGETAHVDVRMQRHGDGWLIHDVVTDDVSLEESYAESFDRILRDEGWEALIQRLRDRIAELRES